jgi:hypothetical protein
VKAFSGDTYELLKNVPLSGHELDKDSRKVPDNGVYDPKTHLFYLGDRSDSTPNAGPKGSIEIVDLQNGSLVGSIAVEGKNPAGLALDTYAHKLYVLMGKTSQVAATTSQMRRIASQSLARLRLMQSRWTLPIAACLSAAV